MRLTAGKIYFWGGVTIAVLTTWNRYSTRQLRTVVDDMKEERMREAERLRMYQQGGQGGNAATSTSQRSDMHMPKHFNPYYRQQEMENEASSR